MDISTIVSKRKRRVIGISYIEPGLPHVEIMLNGKKINIVDTSHIENSYIRLPFNVKLFHKNFIVRKLSITLSKFQKLPDRYIENKKKEIKRIEVERLIIGGGTSGLSALDKNSLLITREILGDIEFDESLIPEIEREELLSKMKEKVKEYESRIINGNFIGKFDEGLLFETDYNYLLVNPKEIIIGVGGRTLRPIFKKNFIQGIVSRELYLKRLKDKYNNIIVLGFTNITARTALNAKKATIIYPKGIKLIMSNFYKKLIEEEGIEIVNDDIIDIKRNKDGIKVITKDGRTIQGQLVVFSVTKQPRIEVTYNIGLNYKFNRSLHIYQPESNEAIKAIGGTLGIMDEYVSYLSGINSLDQRVIKEYEPGLIDSLTQEKSPYLFGDSGMVCECEDLDLEDVSFAIQLGFNNVEGIKRITGLGTGVCQGKVCSYLAGSLTESNTLISFRSPLYPVSL
ncbi:(2Fe-2S)-binding protein [Sulfurisphaera javensis]|uniref:(2Fe-2S)-binding protein n=1 Tax=Sulfurisphaera javensis TaxID=2049879 RepID=A0AAT9GR39_9CREN